MTQWYVKDLSKLTHVSVQTLHHYDRIDLLKPSVRLPNGYRLYSEHDLLKLQQIVALKFFGFELAKIKTLLVNEMDAFSHFAAQAGFLAEKAKALADASTALQEIMSTCSDNKSIPWETIMKLIEVYHMTQELKNSWEGKVLNQDEFKEYAQFEQELKQRFTAAEQKECENGWADIVRQVNANLTKDPGSEIGIAIGKRCMDWVNNLYGKEHASLRNSVWEKGFKGGHVGSEHGLTPESVAWLDQAQEAYYRGRIYSTLNLLPTEKPETVLKLWNELMEDMYGDSQPLKDELYEAAMTDDKVSVAARKWLKQIAKKA